jgi:hypothetical protein
MLTAKGPNVLYAGPTKPIYTPHACSGMTSIACSPVLRIPVGVAARRRPLVYDSVTA